jgi:GWxTD domain-containing protein
MKKLTLLLAVIISLSAMGAEAQRQTTYESLVQRTDQPSTYVDHLVIPETDSTGMSAFIFRLDYDFVPFLRKRPNMTPPTPEHEYFAPVRMGLEVFEGRLSESRRNSRLSGTSIYRDTWSDTVWVSTFEETKSRYNHVTGFLNTRLNKGDYHYELQLGRGESTRELPSRRRNLTIPDYSAVETTSLILLNSFDRSEDSFTGTLFNYGNNVLYGQDYSILIPMPSESGDSQEKYQLKLYKVLPGSASETETEAHYTAEITDTDIFRGNYRSIDHSDDGIVLQFDMSESGYRYAAIAVPNREFENARYKIVLSKDTGDKPAAERIINSQWIDMPVSLYNLDVAINMLKFIVSDSELKRINSGSSTEKERKFREFWAQRDPTPGTEFNELMAEYYRRIDYSYRNFSSLQIPGYETDQGKAYLLYGPPNNIERRLPTNRPAREIWEYSDRTLVFEATTGFGDFRLISE